MTRPVPAALLAGQPVTRVDGRLKVTGKAQYAADHAIPNLVYAALACSTVARGAVESIDSTAAQRIPDVLRVITDFGGVKLPFDARADRIVWPTGGHGGGNHLGGRHPRRLRLSISATAPGTAS